MFWLPELSALVEQLAERIRPSGRESTPTCRCKHCGGLFDEGTQAASERLGAMGAERMRD